MYTVYGCRVHYVPDSELQKMSNTYRIALFSAMLAIKSISAGQTIGLVGTKLLDSILR